MFLFSFMLEFIVYCLEEMLLFEVSYVVNDYCLVIGSFFKCYVLMSIC